VEYKNGLLEGYRFYYTTLGKFKHGHFYKEGKKIKEVWNASYLTERKDLITNNAKIFHRKYRKKPFTGEVRRYSSSETILERFNCLDGKKEGTVRIYHEISKESMITGMSLMDLVGELGYLEKLVPHLDYRPLNYTPPLKEKYTCIKGMKQGVAQTFYNDGRLRSEMQYENNLLHGEVLMFYKDGSVFSNEKYHRGKKKNIECFDPKGSKILSYGAKKKKLFFNKNKEDCCRNNIFSRSDIKNKPFSIEQAIRIKPILLNKKTMKRIEFIYPGVDLKGMTLDYIDTLELYKSLIFGTNFFNHGNTKMYLDSRAFICATASDKISYKCDPNDSNNVSQFELKEYESALDDENKFDDDLQAYLDYRAIVDFSIPIDKPFETFNKNMVINGDIVCTSYACQLLLDFRPSIILNK
jgi:antitoxin component YwqK of YwqJK toxin-antitoxin module